MPAMTDVLDDPVQAARQALVGHDWTAAFEAFGTAELTTTLSGEDLEGFAQAAFFVAKADLQVDIKERAFKAYEAEGDTNRAAYLAIDIGRTYGYAGKGAIASAWVRRAEKILGAEGDGYAHGYLALVRSEVARQRGDIDGALALAEQAITISEGASDADLKAYASNTYLFLAVLRSGTVLAVTHDGEIVHRATRDLVEGIKQLHQQVGGCRPWAPTPTNSRSLRTTDTSTRRPSPTATGRTGRTATSSWACSWRSW